MFSFFSKKDKPLPEPPEQYINLRNSLLTSSAEQLNIQPSGQNPEVWGVLIDENFGNHIQSVWVTASGQIQIFQFAGENKIREDSRMGELIRQLVFGAEACYSNLTPTTTCPLPSSGNIRFSIFTFSGIYTSEVEVRELAISREKHVLADLNNSYHNILFLNNWGKLEFPIDTSLYKWQAFLGQPTTIYRKPDVSSASIATLKPGEEIEIGVMKNPNWITVTLPNGQWGYMSSEAELAGFEQLILIEKEVAIYSEPSSNSSVVTHLKKDSGFYLFPLIKQEGQEWLKIRDSDGNEGFIAGQTRSRKA